MRLLRLVASSLAALPIVGTSVSRLTAQAVTPPTARIIPRIDTLHGEVRTDNYFWIRNKSDPQVISYLEAENAYTTARMKHTEALQKKLYDEMLGRIKETDLSVPYLQNGYWYYNRTEKGKSYPIHLRKKGSLGAAEEVVIDENALAAGKKFSSLGDWAASPSGSRFVYLHDTTALRVYTLYVRDLRTNRLLGDSISGVVPSLAWAAVTWTVALSSVAFALGRMVAFNPKVRGALRQLLARPTGAEAVRVAAALALLESEDKGQEEGAAADVLVDAMSRVEIR